MQSVLHDPRRGATPAQLDASRERRERLDRMQKAVRVFQPVPPVVAPVLAPVLSVEHWIEWQKENHPPVVSAPVPVSTVEDAVPTEPRRPRVEEIQAETAKRFSVTRLDLVSSRRTAAIVRPRQAAMYLAKTLTLRSLPEIGRRFGARDHTTVLHAVRKIAALLPTDEALAEDLATITAALEARVKS